LREVAFFSFQPSGTRYNCGVASTVKTMQESQRLSPAGQKFTFFGQCAPILRLGGLSTVEKCYMAGEAVWKRGAWQKSSRRKGLRFRYSVERHDVAGIRIGPAQSPIQLPQAQRELCRGGLCIQQSGGADFPGRGALRGRIPRDRHWTFRGEAPLAGLLYGAGNGSHSHHQRSQRHEGRTARL
jgi:hypothetical protein